MGRSKKNPPSTELSLSLAELYAWTKTHKISNLSDYPKRENLATAFISTLNRKIQTSASADDEFIEQAVRMDWQTHALLSNVGDDVLAELIKYPYENQLLRMYMLVRARRVVSTSVRHMLMLNFFENDGCEAIQHEALQSLAHNNWEQAEHHAEIWWNSGDTLKRMVALQVLHSLESSVHQTYLKLASESNEGTLKRCASALKAIDGTKLGRSSNPIQPPV